MVEFEFGPVSGDSQGAYVYVDDIRVWSGDSYLPVSKSYAVSDDEIEFTETEAEGELNIFSGNDFEGGVRTRCKGRCPLHPTFLDVDIQHRAHFRKMGILRDLTYSKVVFFPN